jgi:hypothetical protein
MRLVGRRKYVLRESRKRAQQDLEPVAASARESRRFPMDGWPQLPREARKRAQGAAIPTVIIRGVVRVAA